MLDRFTSMEVFLAVTRCGTFAAAAEELNMSRAMASKHVKALEDHLSVRLLDRTTRAVRLTEAGRAYSERIGNLLAELASAEDQLTSDAADVRGTLDVAAPTTFGAVHVAPVVADYMAGHPLVSVRMTLTERSVDLVDEGIDVAIRVGELGDSSYVARRLGEVRMVICAAPAYLAARGTPRVPEDLARHECLVFREAPARTQADWTFHEKGKARAVRVSGRFAANTGDAVRSVAVGGSGIVRLPDYLVQKELDSGALVEVLAGYGPPLRPVHALYPHRVHVPGKVSTFVDFAMRAFGGGQ